MTMTMFETYDKIVKNYINLYDDNIVLLAQIGGFYEIYAVPDENMGCKNINEIAELLNLTLTRKNKSVIEITRSNHLLVGFPLYQLNKYIDILVNNNKTVVLYEQVSPAPNPNRAITRVISPSTYINDNDFQSYENYLMTIYLTTDIDIKTKFKVFIIAIAIFDLATSKIYLYENAIHNDSKLLIDDLYRIINIYKPKEIVFFGDEIIPFDDLKNKLELNNISLLNKINDFNKDFLKLKFQNEILSKVYYDTGMLSPIEYCNLELNPNLVITFSYLINFIYSHSTEYINNISTPIIIENDNKLILFYNCIKKLNVVNLENKNKNSSLLNCSTRSLNGSYPSRTSPSGLNISS